MIDCAEELARELLKAAAHEQILYIALTKVEILLKMPSRCRASKESAELIAIAKAALDMAN